MRSVSFKVFGLIEWFVCLIKMTAVCSFLPYWCLTVAVPKVGSDGYVSSSFLQYRLYKSPEFAEKVLVVVCGDSGNS